MPCDTLEERGYSITMFLYRNKKLPIKILIRNCIVVARPSNLFLYGGRGNYPFMQILQSYYCVLENQLLVILNNFETFWSKYSILGGREYAVRSKICVISKMICGASVQENLEHILFIWNDFEPCCETSPVWITQGEHYAGAIHISVFNFNIWHSRREYLNILPLGREKTTREIFISILQ